MPKDYSQPQEIKQSLNLRIREKLQAKAPVRSEALSKLPAGIQAWVNPIIDHAISRGLWKDPMQSDLPSAWTVAAIRYLVEHEQASFEADLKRAISQKIAT